MAKFVPVLALAFVLGGVDSARAASGGSILTYHGAPDRSGSLVVPALTAERARGAHLDNSFQGKLSGHLYAQPLFWREPGTGEGVLFAATESNEVQALDAATGRQLWSRSLGPPVSRAALHCGNITLEPIGAPSSLI
jgi:hypothetical protein